MGAFARGEGDYIRNRRLSLAGQELSKSKAKVIDIALKYQDEKQLEAV
ncbi:hypothetical protein [Gorillibacterium sp. CAU 1737]